MTDQQINQQIAKACGWTECEHVASIGLTKGYPPLNEPLAYVTYSNGMAQIPNYTGCLNVMHETEKVLTNTQWGVYVNYLTATTKHDYRRACAEASARQKAEAFLRTIKKWEEEA